MSEAAAHRRARRREPRHGVRIVADLGASLTAIVVLARDLRRRARTSRRSTAAVQSHDQHDVNVDADRARDAGAALIWVYFGYAIRVFRQPAARRSSTGRRSPATPRIQIDLAGRHRGDGARARRLRHRRPASAAGGAGGGQGPNPLAKPAGAAQRAADPGDRPAVAVDVPLPGLRRRRDDRRSSCRSNRDGRVPRHLARRRPQLLGVSSSASRPTRCPAADNVAYVKALKTGSFQVRCAELCGLWHGHMNTTGRVVDAGRRSRPGSRPAAGEYAGVTKHLPPYAPVYFPEPTAEMPG